MLLRTLAVLALIPLLLLSCGDDITNIYYQSTSGAVFGNVTPVDSGVAMLDGLVDLSTSIDVNGFFNFADVPPGTYTLEIKPHDYGRRKIKGVIVGTGLTTQYRDTHIDIYPFPIYSVSPQSGYANFSSGSSIVIRCDEWLNMEDLTQMTHFDPPVEGTWGTYPNYYEEESTPNIYAFDPRYPLLPGTTYTMTIDREVRCESGMLDDDMVLTFTTSPFRAYVDVLDNSNTGRVSRRGFQAMVRAFVCTSADSMASAVRFEPEIHGLWFPSDYYNRCGEGLAIDYDFLASDLPLLPKTQYRVIVNARPFGASGEDTAEFVTEGYEVIKVLPRNGYYGVPIDNQVLVVFNEQMDTVSARESLTVTRVGGDDVPGTFSWNSQRTEMMYSHWEHPYTTGQYIIRVSRQAKTEFGDTLDVGWESYFQVL